MPRPRHVWAAVVPVLVLGLAAGCGGSSGDKGVPSANGGKAAKPTPSASYDGRKFAQCMRDHGVDMPDPDPNGGGGLRKLSRNQNPGTLSKALDACRSVAPPALRNPDDPKIQEAFGKFAKCMRDHGVDVPDPDPALGGLGFPTGTFNTADPAFGKAYTSCKSNLAGVRGK
jgi:hypothetical protein